MRKVFLLLVVGLLLVGCSDDSPDTPEVGGDILPPPERVYLVENFVQSMESMSSDHLAVLLHDDFQIGFLQSTLEDWSESDHPLTGEFFDRTAMLSIHANLFSGVEGMDSSGSVISEVESISISVMDKFDAWAPVAEGNTFFEDHPEAYRARYNALIHFNNPNSHRWEVEQMLDLVVVPIVSGETTRWQLLGIYGYSQLPVLGAENVSYDGVLAMYRF